MVKQTSSFALCMVSAVLVAASISSCGGKKPPDQVADQPPGMAGARAPATSPTPGLVMRLGSGAPDSAGAPETERTPPAQARALPEAQTQRLLARLPALPRDPGADFALPPRSRPAPRSGQEIQQPFPPTRPPEGTAGAPAGEPGKPLTVLRFAPEGEVPLAPHLSVTFSQPMVAVTSQRQAAATIPVKLTPTPAGQWRWVGTQTLLFDPDPRFPQATRYRVEIPAGTRAAGGQALDKAVTFEFATPPPQLVQSHPAGTSQPRTPRMLALFDQDIDPAAVLAHVHVRAAGKTHAARLLSAAELAADDTLSGMISAAQPRRHLAFTVEKPLPADTDVVVEIAPGTPSAEGPRTTEKAQSFTFRTHGPLEVVESRCGWGEQCQPMASWQVQFSNSLDPARFDPAAVRVEPALPGMAVDVSGDVLMIHGQSKARTKYEVSLPASIMDVYGQTLGKPRTVTFRVGDAEPSFFGPSGLVVIDPAAKKPSLSVFTMNTPALDVRLHRVAPADWPAFVRYLQRQHSDDGTPIPGTQATKTQVKVRGAAGELVETSIDLGPALARAQGPASKHGHVVAVIEPATWSEERWKPRVVAWVQVTEIGLDAFADQTELIGWATRLADGAPVADVEVALLGEGSNATSSTKTDAGGLARLPLLPEQTPRAGYDMPPELVVIARRGEDTTILPESPWGGGQGFRRQPSGDTLLWYVFDDRRMYRPGEKVSVKGWLRRLQGQELGDVTGLGDAVQDVSYVLQDPQGDELRRGTATIDPAGGFQLEIEIPANANLGQAVLQLASRGRGEVQGRDHYHAIQIQEFRRPAFEVSASAGPGPHIVGQSAQVEMKASYYAGGGLAGADVTWQVTSAEATFTPPNRDDFVFGRWRPWWETFSFHDRWGGPGFGHAATGQQLTAQTDAGGAHVLNIEFVRVDPPLPMSVTAEATVMDVDRQAWSARADLLVHPAALYVGLKTKTTFVERGTPIELQTIVVDIDGRAAASRELAVRAERMVWSYQKQELVPDEAGAQECVTKSADQPVPCTFATALGGQYRITARVSDDLGRVNETQMTMWVSGGDTPPAREVEQERVTLIPDQKSYQPGDTARILVQAPFAPAQGVLTLRRSGIAETRRFTMDGSSTTLEIAIEERHVPNLHVQVDLVGAAPRTDDKGRPDEKLPRRPAYALGQLDLAVPPRTRALTVEVVPAERSLAPGSKTSLDLIVRDARGQPVPGAAMAVVVVDEAVLALSNYRVADPLEVFYAHRDAGARDYHTRAYVKLARPDTMGVDAPPPPPPAPPEATRESSTAPGAVGGMPADQAQMEFNGAPMKAAPGGGASTEPPIVMRTDFRALALFAPAVSTDAGGRARVPLTLPDSLTRYRVTAVAVSGERFFGKGEAIITARKPLMVRPSPPRFLRFGDTFELPVVVQNQTDQPLEVEVAVRAANARFTQGQGRALSVPANQRLELRFPAAAERAGSARLQVVAQAGKATDAAELDVPVWTPVTTEAFATYGQVDDEKDSVVRQPVVVPAGVVTAYGGLEITTSSTELASLTDALLYLVSYPFECSEQVASRVLAVAALRDVLAAFAAENLPSASELQAAVDRDVERLARLQNPDGGFDFWRRGAPSQPYVSLHVAHALARARAKGFAVPDPLYDQARAYVAEVERHIPPWYSESARRAILAYGLYVEKHLGAPAALPASSVARAQKLASQHLNELSLEAVGWLLYALSGDASARSEIAAIHRHLQNRATETAGTAHFATGYGDDAYLLLYSDRRADAVILEALIADQPDSDLIPKVTRGLLAHRTRGRWLNTQENVFVLLAMDRYFQTYEKVTPDFVARVWLGDRFAGEQRFRGRQTDRQRLDVPMAVLAAQAPAQRPVDLTLQKAGAGRLYYRIGMRYAPADLALPAADHGFTVERTYEHVDAPGDVTRLDDGTWKIRAGARVRVRVRMVAPARRYHVALVDPLPAGLEPLNPALAVSQSVPEDPRAPEGKRPYWSWLMPWYEHQNLRDDRAEAFSTLVWADVHEYSYVARATTPGRFVAPPAHAEEMYFPETFGRSSTDRVVVE